MGQKDSGPHKLFRASFSDSAPSTGNRQFIGNSLLSGSIQGVTTGRSYLTIKATVATSGQERKQTLKGRIQRLGRARAWIIGLGTVATALTSVYALTTTLFPALKSSEPPAEIGATLSNLTVEPDVVLGEYLERPGVPAEAKEDAANQLIAGQLRSSGNVVYFEVEFTGFQRKSYYFRWSVYHVDSRKPVDGFTNQPAWPSEEIQPHTQVIRAQFETWIPLPEEDGSSTYLVGLVMYSTIDEEEVRLDSAEVTMVTQENHTTPRA
jgi:hypothetical protein